VVVNGRTLAESRSWDRAAARVLAAIEVIGNTDQQDTDTTET
jgi:hypothetical protein